MRQEELFSYRTLEGRIPKSHPLRKRRAVVGILLTALDDEFDAVHASRGRDAITPERLLRASLLQFCFPFARKGNWSNKSTLT